MSAEAERKIELLKRLAYPMTRRQSIPPVLCELSISQVGPGPIQPISNNPKFRFMLKFTNGTVLEADLNNVDVYNERSAVDRLSDLADEP